MHDSETASPGEKASTLVTPLAKTAGTAIRQLARVTHGPYVNVQEHDEKIAAIFGNQLAGHHVLAASIAYKPKHFRHPPIEVAKDVTHEAVVAVDEHGSATLVRAWMERSQGQRSEAFEQQYALVLTVFSCPKGVQVSHAAEVAMLSRLRWFAPLPHAPRDIRI